MVDDGSQDGTVAAAEAFPVRVLRRSNAGPGSARNAGIAVATQPWIAFCDSDDLWKPRYLETMAAALKPESRYAFSNWSLVRGDTWAAEDRFSMAPEGFFEQPAEPLYPKLLRWTPIWPSATVIAKSFLEEIGGFDPRVSRLPTEDFEFALRCNEHPGAVFQKQPLVGIRKHEGNFSAGQLRSMVSDIKILRFARDHHATGRLHAAAIERTIGERTIGAADLAFRSGSKKLFRELARDVPRADRTLAYYVKTILAQPHPLPGSIFPHLVRRS